MEINKVTTIQELNNNIWAGKPCLVKYNNEKFRIFFYNSGNVKCIINLQTDDFIKFYNIDGLKSNSIKSSTFKINKDLVNVTFNNTIANDVYEFEYKRIVDKGSYNNIYIISKSKQSDKIIIKFNNIDMNYDDCNYNNINTIVHRMTIFQDMKKSLNIPGIKQLVNGIFELYKPIIVQTIANRDKPDTIDDIINKINNIKGSDKVLSIGKCLIPDDIVYNIVYKQKEYKIFLFPNGLVKFIGEIKKEGSYTSDIAYYENKTCDYIRYSDPITNSIHIIKYNTSEEIISYTIVINDRYYRYYTIEKSDYDNCTFRMDADIYVSYRDKMSMYSKMMDKLSEVPGFTHSLVDENIKDIEKFFRCECSELQNKSMKYWISL